MFVRVSPERMHLECERQKLIGWGSELNGKGKRGARCALAGVRHTDVHWQMCTSRYAPDVHQMQTGRNALTDVHYTDVHWQVCTSRYALADVYHTDVH